MARLQASELDGLSPAQRCKKFDDAHGDYVVIGHWIFYEDGAHREKNPYGPLVEPPENERECCQMIVQFAEAKLQLARDEFNNLKFELQQRCQQISAMGNVNNPPL